VPCFFPELHLSVFIVFDQIFLVVSPLALLEREENDLGKQAGRVQGTFLLMFALAF